MEKIGEFCSKYFKKGQQVGVIGRLQVRNWEDEQGQKIESPFVATPPIQRLEPRQRSQVKIEKLTNANLPQDRESVYYFNFRQIPPKSNKPNVLQLTVQTKIKLFYRPENLFLEGTEITNNPWQKKLILKESSQGFIAQNPTPYYITISSISADKGGETIDGFQSFMVAPFSEQVLTLKPSELGISPYITYIDDYGSKKVLSYTCAQMKCEIAQ